MDNQGKTNTFNNQKATTRDYPLCKVGEVVLHGLKPLLQQEVLCVIF